MMPTGATWWQGLPYRMDPYIIELGSFRVGWYGMMYVAAFALAYFVASRRAKREGLPYSDELLQDWFVTVAFGLIIGARLGYVLFYNPGYYLSHPLEILLPVSFTPSGIKYTGIAGMSYHGGLVGVLIASWWIFRRQGINFREFADFIVPIIPLGYTFGRLGNFINGELWGRPTTAAIGMYFPADNLHMLRHPSQLYEAAFEGLFLFIVLGMLRKLPHPKGGMLAYYLAGYGIVRFCIEFFREPDAHLGFIAVNLSMGQLLCLAMVASGAGLWAALRR